MKLVLITCLVFISASLAEAAPREIEHFCWTQAAHVQFNGRGDREAFIANCIADYTPPLGAKRLPYKKPRY
jgi:hypothetical protein